MIRGYFATVGTRRRPVIDAVFQFPSVGGRSFRVRILVDTGADRTILAPLDASRLRRELDINITALAAGAPSRGVGGEWSTRTLVVLSLSTYSKQIKGWSRAKKEALIAGDWNRLQELARGAHGSTSSP